ncbi:hypothetical protein L1887_38709 [Cichorium endivia]|nr:hypothetical protein L1887_38709 [Cichorium endivia]
MEKFLSLATLLKSGFNLSLKHYNNFLLHLFKTKKFRFITHFISQLNSNQIEGDQITHSIFTRALFQQHNYEKAVVFINSQIGKNPIILQNRILDSLVQGLCLNEKFNYPFDNFVFSSFNNIGKPDLAVGFYQNAAKSTALQMNIVTYSCLLSAYCRLKRFEDVSELLNIIEKDRLEFDVVKEFGIFDPRVSKIILHHICMKDINLAIKFLKSRNDLTFPIPILKKLIKNNRAEDAFKLLIGSKEGLLFMDVVDYTILVDGLSKEGHIKKALEVCNLAMKQGVTLNVMTYNSIINGLCHQGCFLEAFRLFDSLEKKKIDVIPSEITYATLIDALSKERYLLDAKELFERMVLKGFKPNIRVYNSLINGYSKIGKLHEVLKIVANLDEKGVKPDEFTVSAVINSFCRNGNMEGALEYYFNSRMNGYFPDLLGFFYLVRGLCSIGRMEESRSVLREMLEIEKIVELLKKVDTGFENESLDNFLVSLCDQGNIPEAILILNEIVHMFFPVGKKIGEGRLNLGESQPLIFDEDDVAYDDFEACYGLLVTFCSNGELKKANKVAKLLAGFD